MLLAFIYARPINISTVTLFVIRVLRVPFTVAQIKTHVSRSIPVARWLVLLTPKINVVHSSITGREPRSIHHSYEPAICLVLRQLRLEKRFESARVLYAQIDGDYLPHGIGSWGGLLAVIVKSFDQSWII